MSDVCLVMLIFFIFLCFVALSFFLHLLCAVQWMTACLFVPGLKEAESILMGSEHLLGKVTATGLARADPATHKVRLLMGKQGVISNLLSSPLSSNVRSEPHYHSKDRMDQLALLFPPHCCRRQVMSLSS